VDRNYERWFARTVFCKTPGYSVSSSTTHISTSGNQQIVCNSTALTYGRQNIRVLAIAIIFCFIVYIYLSKKTNVELGGWYTEVLSSVTSDANQRYQQPRQEQNFLTVHSHGNFLHRVVEFNAFLYSLRKEEIRKRGTMDWKSPNSSHLDLVQGMKDNYMQQLEKRSSVITVVLPWLANSSRGWNSLTDHSNMLIQRYYKWTADNTLCSWIETPGKTKAKYDVIYRRECNRKINDTARPSPLEPLFLNGKVINRNYYWPNNGNSLPAHFYTDTPAFVFYMHIHRDAVVTLLGDVISDGLKLVLYACSNDNPSLPPNLVKMPMYDEVFVITQHWGTAVFHRMVEILPRIALFVDFLKNNPEIHILAPEQGGGRLGELLRIINLDESRLVTGTVRAKTVYQPRSTICGMANAHESQMLSHLYREYIKRTFPAQTRNRLVLIRRSGSRRFTQQKQIEEVSNRAARDFNLTFTLFPDNPTPSLNDTMMIFHSAVIVVGPCGAGLSNVLFSEPGTYVLEGVCNRPHVNLCFLWLSHVLGHHWHGVTSRGGCEGVIDVSSSELETALRQVLRVWSSTTW